MAEFIFAYHDAKQPETPEAGAEHFARWQAWLVEMGDAMLNPGTPLGPATSVTAEGVTEGSAYPMSGYSIVEADDLEAAIRMAQSCPYTAMGTIVVAELKSM